MASFPIRRLQVVPSSLNASKPGASRASQACHQPEPKRTFPLGTSKLPVRIEIELRCGSALGAQGPARGMRGIGLQSAEASVLADGDRAAAGYAQGAVALDTLGRS